MDSPPLLEPPVVPDIDLLTAAASGNIGVVKNIMLTNPGACATVDGGGKTALHKASRHGQADMVALLLHHGAEVNASTTRKCRSPLYDACSKGYLLVASLLLDHGANINARELRGRTAIYSAAIRNHADIVSKLLDQHADYSIPDTGHWRPLFAAAAVGNASAVEAILTHKHVADKTSALVSDVDMTGRTALHYACMGGSVSTARVLLNHGAKCDTEAALAIQGQHNPVFTALSPLHSACYRGSEEMVKLLLGEGKADVNKQDRNQCTALHMSCRMGHRRVVSLLLSLGANPSICNSRGRPAMLEAAISGDVGLMGDLLDFSSCVATPVAATPVHHTPPSLSRSISHTVDINISDSDGRSALHMACYNGHSEIVLALLGRGCRLTMQDSDGQTALHMAALGGRTELISLLIVRGIDTTLKDSNDQTAADVAKTPAIKELILKEMRWRRRRFALWIASAFALPAVGAPGPSRTRPNVLYRLPTDVSRLIISKFL